MYSVLIIDDESLTRQTIKKLITQNIPKCSTIYEADNASNSVEIIEKFSPDIIISDIWLGKTSGLDILEAITPASQIIVITGYRDFEYAQRSINLHVSSFLLKPLKPDELLDAVNGAIDNIDDERSRSNEFDRLNKMVNDNLPYIRQKALLDMIYGLTDSSSNPDVYELDIKNFYFALCELKHSKMTDKSLRVLQMDTMRIFDNTTNFNFEYVLLDREKLVIIIKGITDSDSDDIVISACTELSTVLHKKYPELGISIGISSKGIDESNISEKYDECKRALFYTKDFAVSNIVLFSDINFDDRSYLFHQEMFRLKNSLMMAVDDNDLVAIQHYIKKIQKKALNCKGNYLDFIHMFYKQIFFYLFNLRIDTSPNLEKCDDNSITNIEKMISECDDVQSLNEVLDMAIDNIFSHHDDISVSNSSKHVLSVIEYVSENYASPINLPDIAGYTNLSVEYICRLFKKETGKNIVDYINEVRINKAKAFLDSKSYKIYEVADMVGIQNTQYFSTMFKKYTGMTASEYAKRQ